MGGDESIKIKITIKRIEFPHLVLGAPNRNPNPNLNRIERS